MSSVRDFLKAKADENNWTPETQKEILISFVEHLPGWLQNAALKYIDAVAKHEDDGFKLWRGGSLRRTVLDKLKRLAPIVASRNVRLEGLSPFELRDLDLMLNHIDQTIRAAQAKARQPWRRP